MYAFLAFVNRSLKVGVDLDQPTTMCKYAVCHCMLGSLPPHAIHYTVMPRLSALSTSPVRASPSASTTAPPFDGADIALTELENTTLEGPNAHFHTTIALLSRIRGPRRVIQRLERWLIVS